MGPVAAHPAIQLAARRPQPQPHLVGDESRRPSVSPLETHRDSHLQGLAPSTSVRPVASSRTKATGSAAAPFRRRERRRGRARPPPAARRRHKSPQRQEGGDGRTPLGFLRRAPRCRPGGFADWPGRPAISARRLFGVRDGRQRGRHGGRAISGATQATGRKPSPGNTPRPEPPPKGTLRMRPTSPQLIVSRPSWCRGRIGVETRREFHTGRSASGCGRIPHSSEAASTMGVGTRLLRPSGSCDRPPGSGRGGPVAGPVRQSST